jgi:hypothetical protein
MEGYTWGHVFPLPSPLHPALDRLTAIKRHLTCVFEILQGWSALDARIRIGFVAMGIPTELVDELHEAFAEAKRRFYRDDLRPSEIEGARFSEAAFRILEWKSAGKYTALGDTMPRVPTLMTRLEQATAESDSVRLHIPRALRVIYDFRNKRDVAHLADGIDPNFQDATLVVRNMEWVMAELVRLFHNV